MHKERYDASSIDVLKDLEPVRKNPSMYIGNTSTEGLHHLVYELIDNSIDEHLGGHCSIIDVIIKKDGSISVEDDGRGIPVDIHKQEKLSALELVMTRLHAGGKFNRENYKISGGLHGLGASIINALSESCFVEVKRDEKLYRQDYKYGKREEEVKVIGKSKNTGTKTTFKPDPLIFTVLKFDFDILSERMKERAYLNSKLKLNLYNEKNEKKVSFCFDGGIKQFIYDLNKNQDTIHKDAIYISHDNDIKTFNLEIAFQYIKKRSDKILSFANNISTVNGGAHLNGFKNALLKVIVESIEKNKLFKGMSLKVLPKDVLEGLVAIVSVKLQNPQFEGQTKNKLNNTDVRFKTEEIFKEQLEKIFKKDKPLSELIVNRIAESIRMRDAANKARNLVRRKSGFEALDLPIKLTDCVSKERDTCELFLVEGDSAGSSAKKARDKNVQAILALKGKVLNVEGLSLNKILDNTEIKNIISALGINIKQANENVDKLRYGKIIIMTDADVDGQHITALLLTLFYRNMRSLITNGNLYVAKPPLYRVRYGNKSQYLETDEELEDFLNNNKNVIIQRFKGLGEMNAEQLYDTTMDVNARKLERVNIEEEIETEELFKILMGDDASLRRKFIFDNVEDFKNENK